MSFKKTVIRIVLLIASIALFRWVIGQNGLIGFFIGSFATALVMIYLLRNKTIVLAFTDMIDKRLR